MSGTERSALGSTAAEAAPGAMTLYQDPEALIVVDTDDGDLTRAQQALPQTFLGYAEPVVLRAVDPRVDVITDEAARMEALSRLVSPAIQRQPKGASEQPVIVAPEKILNAVLPPRLFIAHNTATSSDVLVAQPVATNQASRGELAALLRNFEAQLHASKARWGGICPVRSAICAMLGDELLRQVTIDMPERGLLLLRIRDEARMTLDALKSLHEASSEYGTSKLRETTRGKPEMVQVIERLTAERDTLRKEEARLKAKLASLQRVVEEQAMADRKRHLEETSFLENTNRRMQQHLETVKQLQEQERKALVGEA